MKPNNSPDGLFQLLAAVLSLLVVILLSGCVTPDKAFVRGSDRYAKIILPDYIKRVMADKSLKPQSRKIRAQTAKDWQRLIDTAKGKK